MAGNVVQAQQVRGSVRERIYAYIVRYIRERHYAPSLREIAEACVPSSSTGVVNYHLARLKAEGRIGHVEGVARAIWLPVGTLGKEEGY